MWPPFADGPCDRDPAGDTTSTADRRLAADEESLPAVKSICPLRQTSLVALGRWIDTAGAKPARPLLDFSVPVLGKELNEFRNGAGAPDLNRIV